MEKISSNNYMNKILFKLCFFTTAVFLCLLLNSCINQPTEYDNNDIPSTQPTSPAHQEDTLPHNMDNSQLLPDDIKDKLPLLSIEQARMLILSNIDISRYELELINNSLNIDDEYYYTFIVKEDNIVYTPAIIVHHDKPFVYCYEEDGSISFFDNFPLYIENDESSINWNGTFVNYDTLGINTAQIIISSADSNSFMFEISDEKNFFADNISGLAEHSGNTAVFSLNDSDIILFIIHDTKLLVIYKPVEDISEVNSSHTALFYKESNESNEINEIEVTVEPQINPLR